MGWYPPPHPIPGALPSERRPAAVCVEHTHSLPASGPGPAWRSLGKAPGKKPSVRIFLAEQHFVEKEAQLFHFAPNFSIFWLLHQLFGNGVRVFQCWQQSVFVFCVGGFLFFVVVVVGFCVFSSLCILGSNNALGTLDTHHLSRSSQLG